MKEIYVISGPTASGKSAVAIEIAQQFGLEIISADSRQVYKYMNIGTAKVTSEEAKGVPHHLIDFKDLTEEYNAAYFANDADKLIAKKNKKMLVVGGSVFYIQALLYGVTQAPPTDEIVRQKLLEESEEDLPKLYNELLEKDPQAIFKIHPHDKYRLVRALTAIRSTGKPYSSFKKALAGKYTPRCFVISVPRAEVYERINSRVDLMVKNGLFEEVDAILKMGYDPKLKALNTVGYKEVIDFFSGKLTREECIEKIKKETRNFAKRQLTWFKSLKWEEVEASKLLDIFKKIKN
jgi:tRNA dimethylallyltransferase